MGKIFQEKDKDTIVWLATLIAQIILMILEGYTATFATGKVAKESGVQFAKLWRQLPKKYKL